MAGQYLRNTDVTQVYQLQGVYLSYPQIVPQIFDEMYIDKTVQKQANNTYDEIYIGKETQIKV